MWGWRRLSEKEKSGERETKGGDVTAAAQAVHKAHCGARGGGFHAPVLLLFVGGAWLLKPGEQATDACVGRFHKAEIKAVELRREARKGQQQE